MLQVMKPISVKLLFCFCLYSKSLFPMRGHGICSPINRETLLELRSELGLDAHPATIADFSGVLAHDTSQVNRVFYFPLTIVLCMNFRSPDVA